MLLEYAKALFSEDAMTFTEGFAHGGRASCGPPTD
jgi:hypothetical protein